MLNYNDKLTSIFVQYGVPEECRSEIRHLFIRLKEDAVKDGYIEGWGVGQDFCDRLPLG